MDPIGNAGEAAAEPLRAIVEHLADGVLIATPDGIVRFANPAAAELFGRSPAELAGSDLGLPLVGEGSAEVDLVPGGGRPRTAELRVVPLHWEGEPAMLVSLRDVTDRRDAEEHRLRAEREESARLEAEAAARRAQFLAEVGAVVAGSLDAARTLEALAELAVPELADWIAFDLGDGSGPGQRVAVAPGGRESPPEDAVLLELPLVVRGERLGTARFAARRGTRDATDGALARDFAHRAALAVHSARLYDAAQEASEAKSEFLAVMSHELRTPLNAILGYTDLLNAGVFGEMTPEQLAQLERVVTNARHLLEIVDEILTFTRMAEGTERASYQEVDLRPLVRRVADALAEAADDKELRVDVRLPDSPAMVETDPAKVRQILGNLLSNAVKFTDRGSIRVEGLRDGTHHMVRVVDTGIGIDEHNLSRIFDPFWQVEQSNRREAGGTGLGLTVARELAELLGGWLRVESEPGRGSTFTLGLPAVD